MDNEIEKHTIELINKANSKKRVFLVPTRIKEVFVCRICVLSFKTHLQQASYLIDDLKSSILEIKSQL